MKPLFTLPLAGITAALLLTALPGQAQIGDNSGSTGAADPRIARQLDELGLKYEVNKSNNYKVVFRLDDGRTQLVTIKSSTNQYEGLEIRDVTSVAMVRDQKKDFPQSVLFDLLEKNGNYKVGAWEINGGSAPFILQFGLRVSANASATVLGDMLRLAAVLADEREKELTNKDEW